MITDMNDFFSPARFWKYFKYDLNNLKNSYGLSLLIIGLAPIIMSIWVHFMAVFKGLWPMTEYPVSFTVFAFFIMVPVLVLTFPAKTYGKLLDKKDGTVFLTIPASTFEKFLSMLIISAFVVPVSAVLLFWGSDFLLSVIDKAYNPSYSVNALNDFFNREISSYVASINSFGILYLSLSGLMLFFLLCSLLFKKARIGKGILILITIMILVGLYFEANSGHWNFLGNNVGELNAAALETRINVFLNLFYLLIFMVLDLCIYFRLKTLKH